MTDWPKRPLRLERLRQVFLAGSCIGNHGHTFVVRLVITMTHRDRAM